jgi:hypothetical protein
MIMEERFKVCPHDLLTGKRKLCLAVAAEKIFGVHIDWPDRALILHWLAETSVMNVTWERWIVFRLGWLPIVHCAGFMSDEGGKVLNK